MRSGWKLEEQPGPRLGCQIMCCKLNSARQDGHSSRFSVAGVAALLRQLSGEPDNAYRVVLFDVFGVHGRKYQAKKTFRY